MSHPKGMPKQSRISQAVDLIVNKSISVETAGDMDALVKGTEKWEDIDAMVQEVATTMMEMVNSVEALIAQAGQTGLLLPGSDSHKEFFQHRQSFFDDITQFTKKVQDVRKLHEGKSGRMTTLAELVEFSAVSSNYYDMIGELQILLSPSVTSMFLILNDAAQTAKEAAAEQPVESATGA